MGMRAGRQKKKIFSSILRIYDKLAQVHTPELYQAKCEAVCQHVYDSYGGAEQHVYARAGGSGPP